MPVRIRCKVNTTRETARPIGGGSVFGFGLLEDGEVWANVFAKREEILVGGASFQLVPIGAQFWSVADGQVNGRGLNAGMTKMEVSLREDSTKTGRREIANASC